MSNISFHADKTVGGITGWYWINSDTGAWSGPSNDWETAHLPNIQKFVPDMANKTVVQAGGNLGMYPRLLSHMFKCVYTFEPDPLNFLCLTMNCTNENIIKNQAAVGRDNGQFCVVSRVTMQNVGMHRILDDVNQNESFIPIVSLNSYNLKNVGLLMLDLEGYEYNAVLGAEKLIHENRPVIFIERPTPELDKLIKTSYNYRIGGISKLDTVYIPN